MKVRDLLETKGKDVVSIDVSSSVEDAIRSMHARKISAIMVEKNIRHLPVVNNNRVIGMLSVRDMVQTQVKKLHAEIHYLRDYIVT